MRNKHRFFCTLNLSFKYYFYAFYSFNAIKYLVTAIKGHHFLGSSLGPASAGLSGGKSAATFRENGSWQSGHVWSGGWVASCHWRRQRAWK
jgi:hypothetical protein